MPVDDIVEIHCLIGSKDRFHINEECLAGWRDRMRQWEEKLNKATRMEMEPELKEFKRVNHNVVELDDYEAGGTRGGSGEEAEQDDQYG